MARVLVIDDAADLRNVYAEALLAAGHVVSIAEDGEQGLALQAEFGADVLVTDMFMPNRDGIETIREFRAAYPATKIIVVSGHGRLENSPYLATALAIGANATLTKPFDLQVLLDTIDDVSGRAA